MSYLPPHLVTLARAVDGLHGLHTGDLVLGGTSARGNLSPGALRLLYDANMVLFQEGHWTLTFSGREVAFRMSGLYAGEDARASGDQ